MAAADLQWWAAAAAGEEGCSQHNVVGVLVKARHGAGRPRCRVAVTACTQCMTSSATDG